MTKARKIGLVVAALVVAIGVAAAWGIDLRPATAAKDADPRQTPALVTTAVVKPALPPERTFTGVVSARVKSNLGFRVPGKVIERLVDVGQNVRAGQVLMRLDRKDLDLTLTARENAVTSARAFARQAAADEARYRQLLADGWSTRQKYEQIKAQLDSANAQLAAAQAQAEVAKNEAGYSLLVADADGTVVDTLVEPGQVVAAGQPVVSLAHSGPREATVNLPETVRPALGSVAQATVYGMSSGPSPARLRQMSDAADPASRTYEARYVLGGEAAQAPLGATVTVSMATHGTDDASEVPLGALYDDGKSSGVWVLDDATSTVSFRAIQVHRLAEETAFVSGVRPGERIVALGAHLLHEGAQVRASGGLMALQ